MMHKRYLRAAATISVLTVALVSGIPAIADVKPLPPEIVTAKTIYIANETKDSDLIDAAKNEFQSWGRFTVVSSEADADLRVVFSHKYGMDKFGNVAFIVMDVYAKGHTDTAFEAKSATKTILSPEHRTKVCISDFRRRLEPKH